MTGWNLPPGITESMLPGNRAEPPCGICGRHVDDCECPEDVAGDPEKLSDGELSWRFELATHVIDTLGDEVNRRLRERCAHYVETGSPCDAHDLYYAIAKTDPGCWFHGDDL